jgi:hypothetical protein
VETSCVDERVSTNSNDERTSAQRDLMSGQVVSVSLKAVKRNPTSTMSSSAFCGHIALANNMVAIPVPGDGSILLFLKG